jgi:hypothetical protein
MDHIEDIAKCNRTDDLISVLYGEAREHEAAEFQLHMQTCAPCQAEMRAFGDVRESIGTWKFEALSGVLEPEVNIPIQTQKAKSAIAALREFFDLSPLWLKGATAFATVLFCLFAVLALGRWREPEPSQPTVVTTKAGAIYTEQEKDQLVQKAVDEQKAALLTRTGRPPEEFTPVPVNRSQKRTSTSSAVAKGRRPLTKWEREQLAADLRLLQRDDDDIELLSEPINR